MRRRWERRLLPPDLRTLARQEAFCQGKESTPRESQTKSRHGSVRMEEIVSQGGVVDEKMWRNGEG